MKVAAIVPAAGKGSRIKSKIEKPYIELCGKPILVHTLLRLSKNRYITEIVVALSKNRVNDFRRRIINRFGIKKVKIVTGGRRRSDSVFSALKNVSGDMDYILIHDGIRPFITDSLICASLKAACKFGASVVAVPVKSTLKYLGKDRRVKYTPDRRNFWEAQTPQVFRRDLIERAFRKARKSLKSYRRKAIFLTDDSMLVEYSGVRPKVVPGSYSNIKITTPEDLELAKILCRSRK
ncbi:MAG: 2-C-methyl-D-erythritol 4-phosphate cytidylyltransferase [Candidatus Omnitrophica bacterium]|nr:2-C-methyl-D-erythritol 4-phosphate cytidylyltransferase [Candidatus Omnitrophota bacterium]